MSRSPLIVDLEVLFNWGSGVIKWPLVRSISHQWGSWRNLFGWRALPACNLGAWAVRRWDLPCRSGGNFIFTCVVLSLSLIVGYIPAAAMFKLIACQVGTSDILDHRFHRQQFTWWLRLLSMSLSILYEVPFSRRHTQPSVIAHSVIAHSLCIPRIPRVVHKSDPQVKLWIHVSAFKRQLCPRGSANREGWVQVDISTVHPLKMPNFFSNLKTRTVWTFFCDKMFCTGYSWKQRSTEFYCWQVGDNCISRVELQAQKNGEKSGWVWRRGFLERRIPGAHFGRRSHVWASSEILDVDRTTVSSQERLFCWQWFDWGTCFGGGSFFVHWRCSEGSDLNFANS